MLPDPVTFVNDYILEAIPGFSPEFSLLCGLGVILGITFSKPTFKVTAEPFLLWICVWWLALEIAAVPFQWHVAAKENGLLWACYAFSLVWVTLVGIAYGVLARARAITTGRSSDWAYLLALPYFGFLLCLERTDRTYFMLSVSKDRPMKWTVVVLIIAVLSLLALNYTDPVLRLPSPASHVAPRRV